jgi:hypothetical protein
MPEEDLRWDDNFPGWNNSNIVVYGNQWSFTNFYDEEGSIVSAEPRRNSQIIRLPSYTAPQNTTAWIYEFVGWDLNDDGVADVIPATSTVDIHAKAIVNVISRCEVSGHIFIHYISDDNATIGRDGTKTAHCDRGCGATHTVADEGSKLVAEITSNVYTVNDGWISKISAGTTAADLLKSINGSSVRILKNGKAVTGSTKVGTGMVVQLMADGKVVDEVTIVVTGDTNGDGGISVTDMIAVKAHVLKKSTLTGAFEKAADTNGDNKISITDFIQIKAQILGKSQIKPTATGTENSENQSIPRSAFAAQRTAFASGRNITVRSATKTAPGISALVKQKERFV